VRGILPNMGATSKLDMPRGLLIAAVVAWALTLLTDFGAALATLLAAPLFGQSIPVEQTPAFAWFAWYYLILGLPVALTVCLVFGWPLWALLDRRGVRGSASALRTGAMFGFIVGLIANGVPLIYGLETALDENATYESSSYGFQLIKDGLPTALGWLFTALDVAVTAGVGAIAGLTAWRFAQKRDQPSALGAS
jgi:hypothetical protein